MTPWAKWWFVKGGNIYGLWKRRKYTEIKRLANSLPHAAWVACEKEMRKTHYSRQELQEAFGKALNVPNAEGWSTGRLIFKALDEIKEAQVEKEL